MEGYMASSDVLRRFALAALTVAAGLVLGLGHITLVFAQTSSCAPRAQVIGQLAAEYQEKTAAVGIADSGTAIYEILTSSDGSTWTLLFSTPNGISCLMATGQYWQSVPQTIALGPEA
jgi:hypothetical protein